MDQHGRSWTVILHPESGGPGQTVHAATIALRQCMVRPASRCAGGGQSHEGSCCMAARSADIPRAVWLLTAPRLMPIAAAISASDRSA